MAAIHSTRRSVLIGLPLAAALGAGVMLWPEPELPDGAGTLSVGDAHDRVQAGDIWLIDIRRPDEWARTGVPEGAIPLDMRREDFAQALRDATAADPDRPVALICARGVRSRRMTRRLAEAGVTPVIDVPEGMLGSAAGPGWLAQGLPVGAP